MKRICLVLALLSLFSCSKQSRQTSDEGLLDQLSSVSPDSIAAHIEFLASDSLKGRLPGTPEFGVALEYVINQFKVLGLEPAGDNGTYLQSLTIRNSRIDRMNSSMQWNRRTLNADSDYYFIGNLKKEHTKVLDAEVVFAGYGVEAPELNYNNYAGLDVKGKVVLLVNGGPRNFPASERAHFSNFETKYQTAAEKGAIGVIMINPGQSPEANFANIISRNNKRGNFGVLGKDESVFGRRVFPESIQFVVAVDYNIMKSDQLSKAMENLDANSQAGGSFGTVSTSVQSIFSEFQSANAAAKLEGGDENLKSEYVVHTAHLDHVGIGEPVNGDSIYNGAHDNASGIASMLEIARLYTSVNPAPRRSILFVAVTAEEMGLLGSDYFSRYPTVPTEDIVANVNTDMPTLIAPLLSIEPLGAEHSSLMHDVKRAADDLDLEIMPDHMPEQVRFVRSDQYNFIKIGVPAVHIKYGLKTDDPDKDLSEKINDYTKNIYHHPSDEFNDLFDLNAGTVYVKLNFLVGYFVANDDQRPTWNADSFFKRFSDQD